MSKASKTKSKFFCFLVYESPQTNIHTDILSDSKVIRRKSQNLSLGRNFLAAEFFLYRCFIDATTTDIDMLLHV